MHWAAKYVSRRQGRHVVAVAAYQAGERLTDTRTGKTHDYTAKGEVAQTAIITPDGSPAPTRQELWDNAEAAEKRKDAKTGWQLEIALPIELNAEQRHALALDLARDVAHARGSAVDMCIHDKAGNPHVHLLCTVRRYEQGELTTKTADTWERKKRQVVGLGPVDKELKALRMHHADIINRHLAKAGLNVSVDARSYAEQGKDIKATVHLGPTVTAMERKGIKTALGDYNRAVKAERLENVTPQPTPKPEPTKKKRLTLEELREEIRQNLAGPSPKPRPE